MPVASSAPLGSFKIQSGSQKTSASGTCPGPTLHGCLSWLCQPHAALASSRMLELEAQVGVSQSAGHRRVPCSSSGLQTLRDPSALPWQQVWPFSSPMNCPSLSKMGRLPASLAAGSQACQLPRAQQWFPLRCPFLRCAAKAWVAPGLSSLAWFGYNQQPNTQKKRISSGVWLKNSDICSCAR